MTVDTIRDSVERALSDGSGIVRLEATWVAREWLPPGGRLGLSEPQLAVGERGFICERWLGSVTKADNRVGPPDEGLSYVALEGGVRVTLKDAVTMDPATFMGVEYSKTHKGLDRLTKIFDFAERVPFHLHPRQEHAALVGAHQKDEAYYYPLEVDQGAHPESFFGLHSSLGAPDNRDLILPYLAAWDSDLILERSRAQMQVPEQGFHIPSGILHAPGTALCFEMQEDSDVLLMFQALNAGKIVSKDLLFKDVRREDRERYGDRFMLEVIDWEANCDPYFYENHHLGLRLVESSQQAGGEEYWIYYNTPKFSGKKLVVKPGESYTSVDRGVYNCIVWRGSGTFDGLAVDSSDPTLDELLVTHDRAVKPITIHNTATEEMLILKFFGPDVNPDVPMITPHATS
jgi:hypothetical protein